MAGTAIASSVTDQDPPPDDEVVLPGDDPQPEPDGADAAIEAKAREMGWKPLAEYRGPPGKWQPAKDFVERGENILPIVRDQNRRLTERVGKLEGEISGLRVTATEQLDIIKDLRNRAQTADQRGYDRAMAEIETKKRQAVEAGDTTAYDQLVEQAEALEGARPVAAAPAPAAPAPAAPPQNPPGPPVSDATKAFVASNPWFNRDPVLKQAMIGHHIEVLNEGVITDETAQYEEAKLRVIDAYPDRFGAPAAPPAPRPPAPRRRAAAVNQPTPPEPPAPRAGGVLTTIAQIADPAERAQARDAFNRTKRQIPDYTEAEYMALYDDPHGDVLSLQKPRK